MDWQLPFVKSIATAPLPQPGFHAMPTIQFFCVICGTALQAKADARDDVVECSSCARHVPVPRLLKMHGGDAGCAPVLAPEVLALEVKFLCAACRSPLRADARWEGRDVTCPVCKDTTSIPHWSQSPPRPRKAAAAPALANAARLSPEEIAFLTQAAPASPAAAA